MAFDEEEAARDRASHNGKLGEQREERVDVRALYDQHFGRSADAGYGPERGFNRWQRLNDPRLFTEAALEDPVVRAFVDAPFGVYFVQLKTGYREAELFLHGPREAMTGQVEGIEGRLEGADDALRVATLAMNHDKAFFWRITFGLAVSDGELAGQIIYKESEGSA